MWAIAERHAAVVKHAPRAPARRPAKPSKRGFTPLLFAARNGDAEITQDAARSTESASTMRPGRDDGAGHRRHSQPLGLREVPARTGADPQLGPGFTPLHWVVGDWSSELAGEKTARSSRRHRVGPPAADRRTAQNGLHQGAAGTRRRHQRSRQDRPARRRRHRRGRRPGGGARPGARRRTTGWRDGILHRGAARRGAADAVPPRAMAPIRWSRTERNVSP